MSSKRFRIAFSLSGEKRDFVSKVAAILAERLGGEDKILYGEYHEAEFANWKLGLLLQELYHDQSGLIDLYSARPCLKNRICPPDTRGMRGLAA